ncbi:aldo/keto reductase [Dichotomocladium elegans]|nr:aldo/keto reductase [Dichotomocladium elegans]
MGMSDFYGPSDEEENIKVLQHAIDIGCVFWDTADMYGNGHNERLLSKVLKKNRDKIFLCTKFGNVRDEKTGAYLGVCGKPDYVRAACQKSLDRLGVDYIDLYYQHRVDKNVPIEETVKAMAELVKEGKVRYLGLSECSAENLRRACKVHPIAAIEMEYSPWSLDIEQNGVLEAARELGVKIVCYSPLGRGIMTGAIKTIDDLAPDDLRRALPRFQGESFKKNLDIVDRIAALAKKKGVSPSQFVLAWVLAQGDDFFVIPGTRKSSRLDENYGASNVQLTPKEVEEMRAIVDSIKFDGDRYYASALKIITDQ